MTKKLTGTNIATEQATIRLKSFRVLLARLGATIEQKLVKVAAGPLNTVLRKITLGFKTCVDSLGEDELGGISTLLAGMATILGGVLSIVLVLVRAFTSFLGLLTKIGKLIGLLFAEIGSGGQLNFLSEANKILSSGSGGGLFSFLGQSEVGGQIDVNVNAPQGAVKSVKTKRRRGPRLNAGLNMVPAGG